MKDIHPYRRRYPHWHNGYMIVDFLMSALAWGAFFCYRKVKETPQGWFDWADIYADPMLYLGLLIIPVGWLLLYHAFDHYLHIFRRSRVMILALTLLQSLLGCFILLITILSNDLVLDYSSYLTLFGVILILHFGFTSLGRWIFLSILKICIRKGSITFPSVIIGSDALAAQIKSELLNMPHLGFQFLDFQNWDDLLKKIDNGLLTDLIFVDEKSISGKLSHTINYILPFQNKVQLHCSAFSSVIPRCFDSTVLPLTSLVSLYPDQLTTWVRWFKRFFDVLLSAMALLLLSPVIIWIIIKVKGSSSGKVIFLQDRIGYLGKEFQILKFRSMYEGAEKNGPLLSYEGDERCTPFGAFMRKWRLDEIPQFWNVIKGDMSLVGPRPERKYFIDQMRESVKRYNQLLTVRPGITSLGQVKFGYASDLQQMLKRLQFDLIYVENQSLTLDFKILFYTLLVLTQGKGK